MTQSNLEADFNETLYMARACIRCHVSVFLFVNKMQKQHVASTNTESDTRGDVLTVLCDVVTILPLSLVVIKI